MDGPLLDSIDCAPIYLGAGCGDPVVQLCWWRWQGQRAAQDSFPDRFIVIFPKQNRSSLRAM